MLKYIVIGRDESNGNEYVRAEAPATAEEAVALCERLNNHGFNEHTSYRIETIGTRTQDFQLTELFGWYDGTKAAERIINCHECGATVSYDNKFMEIHRQWHNKLLP